MACLERTQVQLTQEQMRALREIGAQRGLPVAELVREAVEGWLLRERWISWEEQKARALAVTGRFSSGSADASGEHDAYLGEAFST